MPASQRCGRRRLTGASLVLLETGSYGPAHKIVFAPLLTALIGTALPK